jgi:hypothetical protein
MTNIQNLWVRESPKGMAVGEAKSFIFDFADIGTPSTDEPVYTAYDHDGTDVSDTMLSGTNSISGTQVTGKLFTPSAADTYRLVMQVVISGNTVQQALDTVVESLIPSMVLGDGYATVIELRDALADSGLDAAYDGTLARLILRASRALDRYTKWEPGSFARASTDEDIRYYDGSGNSQQWLDPFVAAPSLLAVSESGGLADSDYTTYPSTDWFVWPPNAAQKGEPYYRIDLDIINGAQSIFYRYPKSVKVTAPFGYSLSTAIPDEIVQATIIQATRWFKRGQQAYQDTGAIVELGQLTYTKRLDPEVAEIIDHFKRVSV